MGRNTPALPPPLPGVVVCGAASKLVEGRSAPAAPSSCERSSRVIPAGLAAAVEASAAIAARPALAVPRSGAPVSYNSSAAPRAAVTNASSMTVARDVALRILGDKCTVSSKRVHLVVLGPRREASFLQLRKCAFAVTYEPAATRVFTCQVQP